MGMVNTSLGDCNPVTSFNGVYGITKFSFWGCDYSAAEHGVEVTDADPRYC